MSHVVGVTAIGGAPAAYIRLARPLAAQVRRDRPGVRPARPRRWPHRRRGPHRNPRHHHSRLGRRDMAVDRPAGAGAGRVLQLRRPRKPFRRQHPQRGSHRARVAERRGRRRGQAAPEVGLVVARLERGRSLVLRGGVPTGHASPPYDFKWAYALRDGPDETTRLLVRERYAYSQPWARLLLEPVQVISFVMSRKMLRGIKERAERTAARHEISSPVHRGDRARTPSRDRLRRSARTPEPGVTRRRRAAPRC
jgi:hypothetical protein